MSLQSDRELQATREKLRILEERYEANSFAQSDDEHVRELSMRSLRRLINQLREEIARVESRGSFGTDRQRLRFYFSGGKNCVVQNNVYPENI